MITIVIVLSDKEKITEYTKLDITYHPQIIKTKTIRKQKDLSIIREKINNNEKLTPIECSLLVTLPIFDIDENEAEIVEEVCNYIKHKPHLLQEDIIDEMKLAMYLNIIEYVEVEKQNELMEMINMAETYQGVLAQIRNEGKNDWITKGERNIILRLLKNYTVDEIAKALEMRTSEINALINNKVD